MLLDDVNDVRVRQVLPPAAARTADVGTSAVDRAAAADHDSCVAGLGFGGITFQFSIGNAGDTWAAGTLMIALKLQESNDSTDGSNGTWTDVTTDMGLIYNSTNNGGIALTSSKEVRLVSGTTDDLDEYQLGYAGTAKMVRGYLDFTGTHTNGTILGASVRLSHPSTSPV